jgi:hypothetical protein
MIEHPKPECKQHNISESCFQVIYPWTAHIKSERGAP